MALSISRGPVAKAQKVVVYGPEGIGKTTLAARFPDPLFIDTEEGTAHYDVARLDPAPASWSALLQAVRDVKAESPCSTLVLDTADWAEGMAARHVCAEKRVGGIEDFGYGKGYAYLSEEFAKLLDALSDVADSGINVVVTAHAAMRKFEQPDEAASYDRWELKLQKRCAPLLKEWADAILFLNWKTTVETVGEGKSAKGKARNARRTMFCQHHACWDAKNRWGLPAEAPAEYESIAAHIPDMRRDPVVPVALRAEAGAPPAVQSAGGVRSIVYARDGSIVSDTAASNRQPAPPDPANPELHGLPGFWKPALQLMDGIGATVDEVRTVAARKGHFTMDTPAASFPKEYIDGCIVAQWPKWEEEIEAARLDAEPVPFE